MGTIVNVKIVIKVISRILFILSASLLSCVFIALYFSENIYPFLWAGTFTFTIGLLFYLLTIKKSAGITVHRKDAYMTVTLAWIFIGLAGCLPYIISGFIPSFVNAFFESVSGFTTTGSSILTDIEALPKSLLFWRSLTHWIGGIGIIVLVVIIMPSLQIGGYHLFTLESSLQEKIRPKIKAVGNRLLLIYVGLTLAEIFFLLAGSMPLFDSVCHAFGTIATGGFSPKNTSITDYSPYIQYVITVFMFLAGTNFVIHYYIVNRSFGKLKQNEEFRFYILVTLILGSLVTADLFFSMHKPFEEAFRESFFQVISIITCTGFATADYLIWPQTAFIIIFFAMFLGGSTGSTAGGIKMVRHLIALKNIRKSFRQLVSPNTISPIRLNNNIINSETNNSILTFIFIYFFTFFIASLSLLMLGLDGETSTSAVATCMAGIGPGLGTVGPTSNFAHLPDAAKLILTLMMILGRLEIYTFIILFSRTYWKK